MLGHLTDIRIPVRHSNWVSQQGPLANLQSKEVLVVDMKLFLTWARWAPTSSFVEAKRLCGEYSRVSGSETCAKAGYILSVLFNFWLTNKIVISAGFENLKQRIAHFPIIHCSIAIVLEPLHSLFSERKGTPSMHTNLLSENVPISNPQTQKSA